MIYPVLPGVPLYVAQPMLRVRIKTLFGLGLDNLSLNLERRHANPDLPAQLFLEFLLGFDQVPNAGQIDREHANGTGEGAASEKPTAAQPQLGHVQAQPAAHGYCIFRREVRIDVVGKVWNPVLTRNPHKRLDSR